MWVQRRSMTCKVLSLSLPLILCLSLQRIKSTTALVNRTPISNNSYGDDDNILMKKFGSVRNRRPAVAAPCSSPLTFYPHLLRQHVPSLMPSRPRGKRSLELNLSAASTRSSIGGTGLGDENENESQVFGAGIGFGSLSSSSSSRSKKQTEKSKNGRLAKTWNDLLMNDNQKNKGEDYKDIIDEISQINQGEVGNTKKEKSPRLPKILNGVLTKDDNRGDYKTMIDNISQIKEEENKNEKNDASFLKDGKKMTSTLFGVDDGVILEVSSPSDDDDTSNDNDTIVKTNLSKTETETNCNAFKAEQDTTNQDTSVQALGDDENGVTADLDASTKVDGKNHDSTNNKDTYFFPSYSSRKMKKKELEAKEELSFRMSTNKQISVVRSSSRTTNNYESNKEEKVKSVGVKAKLDKQTQTMKITIPLKMTTDEPVIANSKSLVSSIEGEETGLHVSKDKKEETRRLNITNDDEPAIASSNFSPSLTDEDETIASSESPLSDEGETFVEKKDTEESLNLITDSELKVANSESPPSLKHEKKNLSTDNVFDQSVHTNELKDTSLNKITDNDEARNTTLTVLVSSLEVEALTVKKQARESQSSNSATHDEPIFKNKTKNDITDTELDSSINIANEITEGLNQTQEALAVVSDTSDLTKIDTFNTTAKIQTKETVGEEKCTEELSVVGIKTPEEKIDDVVKNNLPPDTALPNEPILEEKKELNGTEKDHQSFQNESDDLADDVPEQDVERKEVSKLTGKEDGVISTIETAIKVSEELATEKTGQSEMRQDIEPNRVKDEIMEKEIEELEKRIKTFAQNNSQSDSINGMIDETPFFKRRHEPPPSSATEEEAKTNDSDIDIQGWKRAINLTEDHMEGLSSNEDTKTPSILQGISQGEERSYKNLDTHILNIELMNLLERSQRAAEEEMEQVENELKELRFKLDELKEEEEQKMIKRRLERKKKRLDNHINSLQTALERSKDLETQKRLQNEVVGNMNRLFDKRKRWLDKKNDTEQKLLIKKRRERETEINRLKFQLMDVKTAINESEQKKEVTDEMIEQLKSDLEVAHDVNSEDVDEIREKLRKARDNSKSGSPLYFAEAQTNEGDIKGNVQVRAQTEFKAIYARLSEVHSMVADEECKEQERMEDLRCLTDAPIPSLQAQKMSLSSSIAGQNDEISKLKDMAGEVKRDAATERTRQKLKDHQRLMEVKEMNKREMEELEKVPLSMKTKLEETKNNTMSIHEEAILLNKRISHTVRSIDKLEQRNAKQLQELKEQIELTEMLNKQNVISQRKRVQVLIQSFQRRLKRRERNALKLAETIEIEMNERMVKSKESVEEERLSILKEISDSELKVAEYLQLAKERFTFMEKTLNEDFEQAEIDRVEDVTQAKVDTEQEYDDAITDLESELETTVLLKNKSIDNTEVSMRQMYVSREMNLTKKLVKKKEERSSMEELIEQKTKQIEDYENEKEDLKQLIKLTFKVAKERVRNKLRRSSDDRPY